MLSTRKVLLRFSELLAIASILGTLALAAFAHYKPTTDFPLELAVFAAFALLMLSFVPACALAGEYVRTVRQPRTAVEKHDGLSGAEIAALIQWAPLPYKLAPVAGISIAVVTALLIGEISWSSSEPFTARHAVGTMLYLACFYLLSLPVLGSAARMPGAYRDNLARVDE